MPLLVPGCWWHELACATPARAAQSSSRRSPEQRGGKPLAVPLGRKMAVGPFWWVPTGALFALVRAAWAYNGCQQVLFLLSFAGFAGRWTVMKIKKCVRALGM